MVAVTVNQKVFAKLKQAYAEKFGASPKLLIAELNRVYQDKTNSPKDVISDKTIRNFFNNTEPMKMQEKNLNFLSGILLECESYQEALRQETALEQAEQTNPLIDGEWLDRYQEYIRIKCGTMKVLSMTKPVQLNSIYANLNVLEDIKGKKQKTVEELLKHLSSESISFSPFNYTVSNKNIAALDAVKCYRKLLIWGSPGAGKTTFLKHLAIHSSSELEKHFIPIFISLKTFADEEDKPKIIDVIKTEFIPFIPEPHEFVQELLEQGRCLILLDGLDEVADVEINRVYRNINTFVEHFSKNRFVMTCRFGASDYSFEQFTEVEMADFNKDQVSLFVKKWFASRQEPKLGNQFLEKTKRSKSIKELTASPLLLTMLCLVFEDSYNFPENRYSLIRDAVNILLRKWDASRRIDRNSINKFNLSEQQKVNLLSKIAYDAFNQERQKYFWQQSELEELIQNYIKNILEITPETIVLESLGVLKTIEANHGLLVKQAKDFYSFSHVSFQEYFVAHYIVESRNPDTLNEVIKQHLTKRQWREVFLMIAGRLANTDEFLKLMFHEINKLVQSEALQHMLTWLDNVTTLHEVKSSSWRAFYLLVDQVFELYTNRLTKGDSTLAQELAVILREFNLERQQIINRSQLSNFALNIVGIHAIFSAKAYGKEFQLHEVSSLLKNQLPFRDNPVIIPEFRDGVNINKEEGVITINIQENEITLDKEHFYSLPNSNSDFRVSNSNDIGEEENIATTIRQEKYDDLLDVLKSWIESFPLDNAPKSDWQQWTNELRASMRLYLNIGWNDVKLSQEQIKTLEDYFYTNILLIECIRESSYSSKELRNQIIDHLLLPSKLIPSELLPPKV